MDGARKDFGIDEEPKSDEGETEEEFGPKFKIVLEKPEPEQVKISKKNCCTVELKNAAKTENTANEHQKMIDYFVAQRNPGWGD